MIIIWRWEMSEAFWSWAPLSMWVAQCHSQAWGCLAGAGLFLPGQQAAVLVPGSWENPAYWWHPCPPAICMVSLASQGNFTPGFISDSFLL